MNILGGRDTSAQSNFRQALEKESVHPDNDTYWCAIYGIYTKPDSLTAAHIFPHTHGQETMTSIFGEDTIGELNSVHTGMLMTTHVEKMFDLGVFSIVPDIEDPKDLESIRAWETARKKAYKIHTWDLDDSRLINPASEKPWCSPQGSEFRKRNGRKIDFKKCYDAPSQISLLPVPNNRT